MNVKCTGAKKVLGGGYYADWDQEDIWVTVNGPVRDNEWQVFAHEYLGFGSIGNWELRAWVICADVQT